MLHDGAHDNAVAAVHGGGSRSTQEHTYASALKSQEPYLANPSPLMSCCCALLPDFFRSVELPVQTVQH